MKLLTIFAFVFCIYQTEAFSSQDKTGIGNPVLSGISDYQLGDEWGKLPVSRASLDQESPSFRRAALATARVGGATGFYLGKFAGYHVMATNHHVMTSSRGCNGSRMSFPLLGVTVRCNQLLGSWPNIDLALFTVTVASEQDEKKLKEVAANFQFHEDIKKGELLTTIGFGIAGNSSRNTMANRDSDCYVFSNNGEYRLMADPDRFNPGSYRAWSFALGCDVSHGDSGSAIVTRAEGKVVGIIWTGRIPKSDFVKSSQNLKNIFSSGDERIWEELSYAVPAKKMAEFLEGILDSNPPEMTKQILEALLAK
ncbi:MAG: serine protease [Oligoflexia bacterium]|nr:serine protease [Oligoflexia bacterium]